MNSRAFQALRVEKKEDPKISQVEDIGGEGFLAVGNDEEILQPVLVAGFGFQFWTISTWGTGETILGVGMGGNLQPLSTV